MVSFLKKVWLYGINNYNKNIRHRLEIIGAIFMPNGGNLFANSRRINRNSKTIAKNILYDFSI